MATQYSVSEAWNTYDDSSRVEVTREFLTAVKLEDYERLAREYPLLFGWKTSLVTPEDVRSVCGLMKTASMMFALCHTDGSPDFNDYLSCGLAPTFFAVSSVDTPSEKMVPDSFAVGLYYPVKGEGYARWLERATESVEERVPFLEVMSYGGNVLSYTTGNRGIGELASAKKDCASILEQLFNLHLVDVATVWDGQNEQQKVVAYSGVSTLWLGLSEMLSGGRAFRCEACGKPSVAFGERRQRVFCSPACRKWANNHPGQKRLHWYIEQR